MGAYGLLTFGLPEVQVLVEVCEALARCAAEESSPLLEEGAREHVDQAHLVI